MNIFDSIKIQPETNCWLYTGKTRNGYGVLILTRRLDDDHIWNRNAYAHIVAYETKHGFVPSGKCLHHICKNKSCINPSHLELLDIGIHPKRHSGINHQMPYSTHCRHGHLWNETNTYSYLNKQTGHPSRQCRECWRIRSRARYHQVKPPD